MICLSELTCYQHKTKGFDQMNALQLATKIKNNSEWRKAYDLIANAKSFDKKMKAYQNFEKRFGINLNDSIGIYVKGFL